MTATLGTLLPVVRPDTLVHLPAPDAFDAWLHRFCSTLIDTLELEVEQADGVRPMTPAELLTLTAPLRRDDR